MNKYLGGTLCAGVFSLGLITSPSIEAGVYTIDFWLNSQKSGGNSITINGAALNAVEIVSETPFASATLEIDDSVDGVANGFVPLRSGNVKLSSVNIGGASYDLPGDVTRDEFLNITDPTEWLGVRLDGEGNALRFDIPVFSFSNSGSIVDDEFSGLPVPQLTLIDENPDGSEDYIHELSDGTFALLTATQADMAGFVQEQFNDLTQITALGQQTGIGQLGAWNAPLLSGGNFNGFLRISSVPSVVNPNPPVRVSEPHSLALLGLGLVGLLGFNQRKSKKQISA